ncbi:MAG: putative hydroxymethylpyrimidine transporter CytX [Chloroflexi bacterium]|nr:putative hydroxymethylpyrimidine transporter CytX [Chloroflexota bacterium]
MATIAEQARAFGIEPVPPERRTLGFFDTFVLWADLGVSFLVMVVGMFLVPGLGLGQALAAILIGALIGNFLLGLIARVGADTGVPTMVLFRPVLGLRGSYAPSVVNILQLLGWATFEVIVMAQAANLLGTRLFGLDSYLGWAVFFAVLSTAMALGGPVLVVKQWMEKFAVWAVLITVVWLTVAVLTSYDIGALLAKPGSGEMSFWLAVDLVAVMPSSWLPLVADYSRFARSRQTAFWGTGLGYFVSHVWFYALGALLALSAAVAFDPNAPIAPLLTAIAGLTAGWVALLVLLVAETDEAFANIYSTAVSTQNILSRAGQRGLVVAIGAVTLVLAATVPLVQYESFLLLIGAVFVPLAGILAADYFVLRGQRYDTAEMFRVGGRYWYQGGVNWRAVGIWLLGFVLYLLITGLEQLGLKGLAPWLGGTLPTFFFGFLAYVLVGRLAAQRASVPRAG